MSPEHEPAERRPIRSRDTGWARKFSAWMVRRGVSPNMISVAGMLAGLSAGGALAMTAQAPNQARWWWFLGALLVQARLLANLFDGMVAIASGRASAVGELYNEVPDRVSDVAILLGLGAAAGSNLHLGYIAAGAAVFVAYVRAVGKVAGGDQEFCGPMAKPQRMFLVTVASLYAALAPAACPPVAEWILAIIVAGCAITAIRRLSRTSKVLKGGNKDE